MSLLPYRKIHFFCIIRSIHAHVPICTCYSFISIEQSTWISTMPVFWIRHGCICNGYTEFWLSLNMVRYASIMPEHDLMSVNIPDHWFWICLIILYICQDFDFEYVSGIEYANILNIPYFSDNNIIIIVNNAIIL